MRRLGRALRIAWYTLAGWLPVIFGLFYFGPFLLVTRLRLGSGTLWVEKAQAFNHAFWKAYFRRIPFLSVSARGLHRLPKDRAFILIANHSSFLDVPLLFSILPEISGMARDYLFRVPLLGIVLRALGFAAIGRMSRKDGTLSLLACRDLLEQGRPVLVMPEGERSAEGGLGRFSLGAFHLAALTQAPLVPAALKGLDAALPRGRLIPQQARRVPVTVEFFEPQSPPRSQDREDLRKAADRMRETLSAALRTGDPRGSES